MMILAVAAVATAFVCLAALVRQLAHQFVSSIRLPATTEWIEELSIERYRPMLRLLDENDLDFLRTQPGVTPAMATKLRVQRCQIFRGYLRNLEADFRSVCTALKIILLHSNIDRPDLASALVQNQMTFAYRKMRIEFQVVLFRYGIATVDVRDLVRLFDGMRMQLQALVPAQSAVGA